MFKKLLRLFFLSVVMYLCICWVRATKSYYLTSYTFTLCYFAFSYACFERLKLSNRQQYIYACVAIILGFMLIELPVRVVDFSGTISTLIITLFTAISVILAFLCWIEKRIITYFLALVILILLNISVLPQWVDYIGGQIK